MADALALYILREEYCTDFEKLFSVLLKHGPLKVADLMSHSGLSFSQIKEILVIMIIKNMVSYKNENLSESADLSGNLIYEASVNDVLNVLKFVNEYKKKI